LLCIPPPFYSTVPIFGIQPDVVNFDLPRIIPVIAKAANVGIIDFFSALGGEIASKRSMGL
jgi:hypothetical protein